MTRVALCLVVALLVSGCSFGQGSEPGGENDAEAFKKTMDALARELLPELRTAVHGGEVKGLEADFYEPGGSFGVWKYNAQGVIEAPRGSAEEIFTAVASVFEEHGLKVERDPEGDDVTGRKDGVLVKVARTLHSEVESVSRLDVVFVSDDGLSSRDDFAEDSPPEDYTTYVK
ncbi:hypothetical protein [Nocardioides sp. LHG3406-4]|uniref:hypothetical protein n=1 Tax=Nocardioides sp. LHG3406-4 TaxID=2804575 RepID=UPI003CF4EE33